MEALIGLGVPAIPVAADTEQARTYAFEFLRDCGKPKLFVSGGRDQFGPRAQLEALIATAAEPKKLVLIEGADHFFEDACVKCGKRLKVGCVRVSLRNGLYNPANVRQRSRFTVSPDA